MDDGYSGLNFNRPGFQRMIQDIQSCKVNLVITKDLSRLGRNYIETDYYTEHYFKDVGVRYCYSLNYLIELKLIFIKLNEGSPSNNF